MNEDKTRIYLRGQGPHFEDLRRQIKDIAAENPGEVVLTVNGEVET